MRLDIPRTTTTNYAAMHWLIPSRMFAAVTMRRCGVSTMAVMIGPLDNFARDIGYFLSDTGKSCLEAKSLVSAVLLTVGIVQKTLFSKWIKP